MDVNQQISALHELCELFSSTFGECSGDLLSIHSKCSQDFHINILKASGSNLYLIKNKYKIPFRDFKCQGEYFEPNNESALLSVDFVQFEIQRLLNLERIAECPLKP